MKNKEILYALHLLEKYVSNNALTFTKYKINSQYYDSLAYHMLCNHGLKKDKALEAYSSYALPIVCFNYEYSKSDLHEQTC